MTRIAVSDLVPATPYKVQVRAVSDGEYSEWSESFTFTTTQNTQIPAAPATVTWVVQGDGFFATWTEVTQDISGGAAVIDSYELELTGSSQTKIVVVPAQKGQSGSWALDFQGNLALWAGVPQGSISLRVRAVNNKGLKGNWSGSINASNPVPANVSGFTGVAAQNGVDLTWASNTDLDLDHYEVFVGTTAGFTPNSGNRIFTGIANHFFYFSTTYSAQYFKIRAIDKFGQASASDALVGPLTPTSPFGADTTAPATPTGLAATITTSTSSTLATSAAVSWTANGESDLAGYFVRYRVNGTTPWNVVRYDKTQTSAVISNLVPYVNYDFQISAVDWSENMSAYSSTATGTAATNAAPSTPTAPTVSTGTLQAQVTVPGTKAAGGAMEADVVFYEIYGSNSTGFTPAAGNMLGQIAVGPAMIATFDIPASGGGSTETWYFKIIAVDNGGLKSTASAQTSGTPGLIQAANITNATITNAQINDLAANKITAGTGIINNLSVKSVLTIGDASTTGSIQSFDYSAGTAGFKLSSVVGVASLEINQGTIRSPALLIQKGENLIYPAYADFEWAPSWYTGQIAYVAGSGVVQSTDKFFNTQALQWTTSSTSNALDLSASQTTHNMIISASTTYIISFYAMVKTGGIAATLGGGVRNRVTGGTTSTVSGTYVGGSVVAADSTWARYTLQVTSSATADGPAHVFLTHNANGTVMYIDGLQIEEKWTSATTASAWTPPSTTTIDGGMIRTGSIISNGTAQITSYTPVRDTSGNTLYYDNPTVITDPSGAPAWSINTAGAATLSNLSVTGNVVVGNPATTQTTTASAVTFNSTSASPTITAAVGTFYPDDVGLSFTGTNFTGTRTVLTYINSAQIILDANASASGTGLSGSMFRRIQYRSQMASANYVPGTTANGFVGRGWVVRSDGFAEFNQVKAGSFDGAALKVGTVKADAITTGTMTADVSIAGSFTTTLTPTPITLTTTLTNVTVTCSAPDSFYPDDVGCYLTSAFFPGGGSLLIVAYNSPTSVKVISGVGISAGTDSAGSILRGRSVTIDRSGVTLTNAQGNQIIVLPTDPSISATFTGSVTATTLSVDDYFRMGGTNNALVQGSTITMSPGTYTPTAPPVVAFGHTNRHITNNGVVWESNASPIDSWGGAYYDNIDKVYYEALTYSSGSTQIAAMGFAAPGNANTLYDSCKYINLDGAFGPNPPIRIFSITADSSNFYVMYLDWQANYKMSSISRAQWATGAPTSVIGTSNWTNPGSAFSIEEFPQISMYGGNMYLAVKREDTNKLVIQKFTGASVLTGNLVFQTTKETFSGGTTVKSITVGKFDMGGTNIYAAVSMSGGNATGVNMYQVTTSFVTTSFNFPYNSALGGAVGAMWLGTSTDDSTGKFQTWGRGGTLYDHTAFANLTAGSTIKATMRWRNDGSGGGTVGISPASPVASVILARRATLNISTPAIPDIGGDSPNSVSFYIGVDAAALWRYTDPAVGVTSAAYTALRTSNAAGTTAAMASGTPAIIQNGGNLAGSTLYIGAGTAPQFKLGPSSQASTITGILTDVATVTTNASGDFTYTHNMGGTSQGIFITSQTAANLTYRISSTGGTSFTARVFNVSTNAVHASTTFSVNILIITS